MNISIKKVFMSLVLAMGIVMFGNSCYAIKDKALCFFGALHCLQVGGKSFVLEAMLYQIHSQIKTVSSVIAPVVSILPENSPIRNEFVWFENVDVIKSSDLLSIMLREIGDKDKAIKKENPGLHQAMKKLICDMGYQKNVWLIATSFSQ